MVGEPRVDAVMLDLLLLENQLPFFVIEELYKIAFPNHGLLTLLELSFNYFKYFIINNQALPNMKIEHFTDLIRTFKIASPTKQPERGNEIIYCMYSATQLHEEGLKFYVVPGNVPCFDFRFVEGVLEIPRLELTDRTTVVYQNIIALEQIHYIEDGYFTDYFIFMDSLIKTREDVDLLRDKSILFNPLDNGYAAEFMIKNLNKGISLINMGDVYSVLAKDLNRFGRSARPRPMAVLKREFFSTPSQATSTIITIGVITVLTLIQTVCSIMQVTGSS